MTTPAARQLPALQQLTWDQTKGHACVWCKRPLTTGAVSAGTIRDQDGAHNLDTEVWSCPLYDADEGKAPVTQPKQRVDGGAPHTKRAARCTLVPGCEDRRDISTQ